MKSYQSLLLLALCLTFAFATFTNNTKFWANKLNVTDLHYQVYSGFQQIDLYYPKGQTGMFYNLFSATGHDISVQSPDVPLLIWLQGGPGSSSQFGAFTQLGPIRINKGKVEGFQHAWNSQGHLLFIDSPLNVGFSYNGPNRDSDKQVESAQQAGSHLVNFLINFYKQWPTLKKSPLYITGESYAGHYIPCLARKIINDENAVRTSTGIKLVGVSIGDGWTDPINQINYYDSYLWSVGVVSNKFRDTLTWYQTNAIINIYQGNYANATAYFDFITNNDTTPEVYMGNISIFNFRNYNGIDQSFAKFLNDNKAQFNAPYSYIPGNDKVYTAFANDVSRSYSGDVVTCLRNIRVLLYNGQNDVVVNTAGVLQYVNSLNWADIAQWKRSPKQIWSIGGQIKGWAKVWGNLWFVLVNNAGHMVPSDTPTEAFNMLGHFLKQNHEWRQ